MPVNAIVVWCFLSLIVDSAAALLQRPSRLLGGSSHHPDNKPLRKPRCVRRYRNHSTFCIAERPLTLFIPIAIVSNVTSQFEHHIAHARR